MSIKNAASWFSCIGIVLGLCIGGWCSIGIVIACGYILYKVGGMD